MPPEQKIEQLEYQVQEMRVLLSALIFSDRYLLAKDLQFQDGRNIILATGTGTRIGTATGQRLGFFNTTPIAQPSSTGETSGFTAGVGTAVRDDSTFTGNTGATAYRISDIVRHLKLLGLIAS